MGVEKIKLPSSNFKTNLKLKILKLKAFSFFRLFLVVCFVICSLIFEFQVEAHATFVLGTKNLEYSQGSNRLYLLKDINANVLEYGGEIASASMILKLAQSKKDNLLDQAWLVKGDIKNEYVFMGQKLNSDFILGYTSIPTGASLEAVPVDCMVGGYKLNLAINFDKPGNGLALNTGFIGLVYLSAGSVGRATNKPILYDTFVVPSNLSFTTPLGLGIKLEAKYALDLRMADADPLSFLLNHGPEVTFNTGTVKLSFYDPVQEMYLRDKYAHQGRRTELWASFPTIGGFYVDFSGVEQSTARTYSLMLSRSIKSNLSLGVFLARDFIDRKIGFQMAFGQDNFKSLGDSNLARESIDLNSEQIVQFTRDANQMVIGQTDNTTKWYLDDWFLQD
ncbi:MAG: hypothetical protein WC890_00775 [Candidatus Margulisiibacteriota bacterium]